MRVKQSVVCAIVIAASAAAGCSSSKNAGPTAAAATGGAPIGTGGSGETGGTAGGSSGGMAGGSSGGMAGTMNVEVAVGRAVADFMIARWPELDATAADCTGPANCFSMNFATAPAGPAPKFWEYTYGVPVYGVQKLYEKTGKPEYLAYVRKYVDRYVDENGVINYGRSWPTPAGAPNDPTIQDVIQPSILLFGLYQVTHDQRYLTALSATRRIFDSIAKNSEGAFWHKPSYPDQQWLDGIYMSEPFLVRYGASYADQALPGDATTCFDTATFQIKLLADKTFDADKSLYRHAWNGAADGVWRGLAPPSKSAPPDGVRASPILWSRSIGWYIAGIVDVLENLPAAHRDRARLIEIVTSIAVGLKRFQDPATGLFYQVTDVMDGPLPAEGGYAGEGVAAANNWLETSASAIFAYSLAKAVRLGVLPAEHLELARAAWRGVKSRIDIGGDGSVNIHGTVVGLSVGGTYNAYANADFRTDLSGALPTPAPSGTCPPTGAAGASRPLACKYIYVRDNVPQGFGAVLLAASEME